MYYTSRAGVEACAEYTPLLRIMVRSSVALEMGDALGPGLVVIYICELRQCNPSKAGILRCIKMLTGVHPALFSLAATRVIVQSLPPHPEAPRNAKPPGLGCSPRLLDVT